jgi:hypothetical protein
MLAAGFDFLRHPSRPQLLSETNLTVSEQRLLKACASACAASRGAPSPTWRCARARGWSAAPAARTPVLLLPRENRTVVACVRALRSDPRWTRMVHLALVAATPRPRAGKTP